MLVAAGGKALLLATAHNGCTALHLAAKQGYSAVAQLLADAGGEELLLAKQSEGQSALHLAASEGHTETARLLATAGGKALLLATDKYGYTALYLAAQDGHAAVALLLVDAGGKELLLTQCIEGQSALHQAAAKGHSELARVLATSGGKALLHLKEHRIFILQRPTATRRQHGCWLLQGARRFFWPLTNTVTMPFTSQPKMDMQPLLCFWWMREARCCCISKNIDRVALRFI